MASLTRLETKCDEVSGLMKVLAHPDRLRILCALSQGELAVSELERAAGISQSATSQFLKRMKLEGVLSSRRQAASVFYAIKDPRVTQLMQALYTIFCKEDAQ